MIKRNGYTLIEVIVAISVLMIISGISLINVGNIRKSHDIDSDANLVKEVLSSAYIRATAVNIPDGCDLYSYKVNFVDSNINMYAVCNNLVQDKLISSEELTSSKFESNYEVEFKSYTGNILSNNYGEKIGISLENDIRYVSIGSYGVFEISAQ